MIMIKHIKTQITKLFIILVVVTTCQQTIYCDKIHRIYQLGLIHYISNIRKRREEHKFIANMRLISAKRHLIKYSSSAKRHLIKYSSTLFTTENISSVTSDYSACSVPSSSAT